MRFRMLGEVAVERDGECVRLGGPQQRRLLALLLSARGRVVSTDRLVAALWADGAAPEGASRSVMKYVSRLRAVMGEAVVLTVGAGYRLELDGHRCDADEFDALVDAAGREMPDVAVASYDVALGMWRGDAFGEFGEEWWARAEAARLSERRLAAEVARAATYMAIGQHGRAVPQLERLTAERPLDEQPVQLLMQALHATGRQAEAMRVGRSFRRRLAHGTGLEPSAELARLERAVVAGDSIETSIARPLRGYTIHEAIGEGAHGRVYVATQPGTERPVAIKVIRPDLADSTEFVRRFEAEAQLVARLEHPHIVPLYDYWREPGGAFLVFRLLSGGTARDSVISGGSWSLRRVSLLIEQIGGALMSAHGAGVAHNDIKASNVLLDDDGAAYLSDFGIAVTADGATDGVAADVRGLGWMAWELLAGSRPPSQRTVGSSEPWLGVPSLVGRMSSVPDGVDAVVRRAVDGGYGSIAELVLAWRAVCGGSNGPAGTITSDARRVAARQLARAATAVVNPYRGLRPFDEADAASLYGRDGVADTLVGLVAARRLVTVVGASGSGKSSVVLAGLVPRLRAQGDLVVTMVPGDSPLDALRVALTEVATAADSVDAARPVGILADLARRVGRMVVVVDQFEECWTRSQPDQRDAFMDVVSEALADESIDVRFVTTVRADLLDRPLEHPTIGPQVGAGSYVLAPLSPAELEAAVVQPATRVGVAVDAAVVADLIADAVMHAGSLPLLQFTLTELYDRRVDGIIGSSALESIGGMAGALGRRAEAMYLALSGPGKRTDARELFARLVAPGADAPDTRRRALLGELSTGMRDVADRFVAARLLVADRDPATREPTVEVAHEALLTRWFRLVEWVAQDRRWLGQLQHLAASARSWNEGGHPDAELYRGSRLEAAIEAIDIDGRAVSQLERRFVEAGRDARDAEVRSARRTARRLRRLLVAAVGVLVIALVAGALALVERRRADDSAAAARLEASRAETAAGAAQIEALVGRAESLRETQRDTAALLAVEAFRLADTPRTRSALFGTFTDQSGFYDAHRLHGSGGGIVMPDGTPAYVIDSTGRVHVYGLDSGSLGTALPAIGAADGVSSILAASRDGRWLAQAWRSGLDDGPTIVAVFDTRTETLTFPAATVSGVVWSATFTPDASGLALAVGEEGRLLVLDRANGERRASVAGVELPARSGVVGIEPQAGTVGPVRRPSSLAVAGDDLLLGTADGSLRIFDAVTFELRRTLSLSPDTLTSLRPLNDGTLLSAGRRGVARVDLDSGRLLWQHEQGIAAVGDGASGATCAHLAVTESRGTFYCGNSYGRLAEHDLRSGFPTRVLDAQNGNSGTLWPARDDTELVSFADNEPLVSRWRLDGSGPITHVVVPGYRPWAFNPSGDLLIVEQGSFGSSESRIVEVESGEVGPAVDGLENLDWFDDDTVMGGTFNTDGSVETAHIDLADGRLVADRFIVDPIPSQAIRETGKERYLLVYRGTPDTILRQIEPQSQALGPAITVDGYVSSAISASGHRIAAGTGHGIEIYDGFTGEQVGVISGTDLRGVFITVTDQLFVSSLGGELALYDMDTLEPIRSFGGSRGFITQVHGTADGSIIATNGGDHSVILYDVASGLRIGTPISIPDNESNWIALSLDGRWMAAGGEADQGQDAPQIWSLEPERWITAACRVAGRNLTRHEWDSNIGALAPYRATCPDLPPQA